MFILDMYVIGSPPRVSHFFATAVYLDDLLEGRFRDPKVSNQHPGERVLAAEATMLVMLYFPALF